MISRLERIILGVGEFRKDNVSYCRFVSFVEEAMSFLSFRRRPLSADNNNVGTEEEV